MYFNFYSNYLSLKLFPRFGGNSDHKRDRDRYDQYPNKFQGQRYRDNRDRNHRGGGGGGGSNKQRFVFC